MCGLHICNWLLIQLYGARNCYVIYTLLCVCVCARIICGYYFCWWIKPSCWHVGQATLICKDMCGCSCLCLSVSACLPVHRHFEWVILFQGFDLCILSSSKSSLMLCQMRIEVWNSVCCLAYSFYYLYELWKLYIVELVVIDCLLSLSIWRRSQIQTLKHCRCLIWDNEHCPEFFTAVGYHFQNPLKLNECAMLSSQTS